MRWTCKYELYSTERRWEGRKNGIKFSISELGNNQGYYILGTHVKEDLSMNSLWGKLSYSTLEEAKRVCEEEITLDYIKEFRSKYLGRM